MTYRDDLDEAIDRAVSGMMNVDPGPGLRRRVLARLEQNDAPRFPRQLVRVCFVGGPVLALVIVLLMVWTGGGHQPQVARSQPAVPAAQPPASGTAAPPPTAAPAAPALAAAAGAPQTKTLTRDRRRSTFTRPAEVVSADARQPDRVVIAPLNPLSPIQMAPMESDAIRFDSISIDPIAIDPLRVEALSQTPR